MSEGVEWALHCTWTLAAAPSDESLSSRRLAEFYDLPGPYLSKVLNALVRAGILAATSGPRGGFRLARPADQITAADVIEAIEGRQPMFTCTEIRQRGPVPLTGQSCRKACGIARLMAQAEQAWRTELAATTIADLIHESGVGAPDRLSKWLAAERASATLR
jgi:Rrf2 family protein